MTHCTYARGDVEGQLAGFVKHTHLTLLHLFHRGRRCIVPYCRYKFKIFIILIPLFEEGNSKVEPNAALWPLPLASAHERETRERGSGRVRWGTREAAGTPERTFHPAS